MEVLAKRIDDLIPADYNPRAISEQAMQGLRRSIDRFGLVEPIIWNRQTGRVVGGHQRLKVLRERGVEETQVIVVDLPDADEKALNVTLNNPNIQGHFTKDLQLVLEEIKVELPEHFVDLQLDDLHIELAPADNGEADAVPEKSEKRVKEGQLWECGRHRLLCGDATDPEAWSKLMGEAKARMAFTDPPYNADYAPEERPKADPGLGLSKCVKTKRKLGGIAKDDMSMQEYHEFLRTTLGNLVDVLKAGGTFYLCCNYPSVVDYSVVLADVNVLLSTCIVWDKGALIPDRKDYHASHEFILHGWRKGAAHLFRGQTNETDTWLVKRDPAASYEHPTQKPTELAARAIRNSSKAGDLIVDCFGGSGSTMIACEQTDRDCRMMEIEPKWCDVILGRWERFSGLQAKLSNEQGADT